MVQRIGQITNADFLLNEVDLRGRVAEFDLGEFGFAEIEHSALGMIGILKLPGRPVQSIDAKVSFEWLDETVERDLLLPTKTHRAQLHSKVDVFDQDGLNSDLSHTLVTHIGFNSMKRSGSTAKLGEQMGTEYDLCVSSFSQKVYGEAVPIIEFDVWNGIYNVNGEPVWPN